MRPSPSTLLVPFALVLAGCGATTYQKADSFLGFGYVDEKISEGVYRIKFAGNGKTSPLDAMRHWHTRAVELCGSKSYEHSAKTKVDRSYDYKSGYHYFPTVEGVATCKSAA